jgi:hypothetical protein
MLSATRHADSSAKCVCASWQAAHWLPEVQSHEPVNIVKKTLYFICEKIIIDNVPNGTPV